MVLELKSLRDYVSVLFRYQGIVVLSFLTIVLSVYFGLEWQTPVYTAQVKMLITGTKESGAVYYKAMGVDDAEIVSTQSEMVKSMPILTQTVKALGLEKLPVDYEKNFASPFKQWVLKMQNKEFEEHLAKLSPEERDSYLFNRAVEQLRGNIDVELLRRTNLLAIRVQDYDPNQAAALANVVSRAYIIFDLQQQLAELKLKYGDRHPIIQQLSDSIHAMQQNLQGKPLDEIDAIGPATVKIIEQAYPPLTSTRPPKMLILALTFVLGTFLSFMAAFLMDYLDPSVKTPRDAERFLKIPPLGAIPKKGFWGSVIIKNARSRSRYASAYRNLVDHLRILAKEKNLKTILFVSTEIQEGTTSVVANTGFLLANYTQKNVLMVDVNLRHPALHACFKQDRWPGLMDCLEGEKIPTDVLQQNGSPNLKLLASGERKRNAAVSFDSLRLGKLLENLKEKYDFVLLDCANLRDHKDALILTEYVDAVVIVISENRTNRYTIQNIQRSFNSMSHKLIGFVFNNRSFVIPKFIYERV